MHRIRKLLPWCGLLLLAVLPIVAGLAQRRADGWYPESDEATIVMLADDVVRGDPPLVGMVSTGGAELSDPELHHPGPLELYLVAPFSAAFGPASGPPVAAAFMAVASIAALVWALHSLGGRSLAAAGLLTSALVLWGVGGDAPTSVWNPYAVLLPFAAFLASAAAAAAGRRWALLGVVALGSLVAQTHLSYAGLVGVVVLWVVVVTGRRLIADRSGPARPVVVSLAVGLVLWLPPIVDQIRGEPGNLGQIWRSLTGSGGTDIGSAGLGELGRVSTPLFGLRPRPELVRVLEDPTALQLAPLFVLVALLLAAVVVGWAGRHSVATGSETEPVDQDAVAVAATALVAVAAGCLTAVRIPLSDGIHYQYYGLWMWPLAAMAWTLAGWAIWRSLPDRLTRPVRHAAGRRWAPAVVAVALVVCAALPRPGTWEPWAQYRRVAGDVAPAAGDVDGPGPVVVRFRGPTPYLSTGSAVALAVTHAGTEVLMDPGAPTPVFPWREKRRFVAGDEGGASREIWVVGGSGSGDVPQTAVVLARTPTLDDDARSDLEAREADAARRIRGGVRTGPRTSSDPEVVERVERAVADPAAALADGELAALAARGLVTVPGLSADDLFTLDRLRVLASEEQVTVYLVG